MRTLAVVLLSAACSAACATTGYTPNPFPRPGGAPAPGHGGPGSPAAPLDPASPPTPHPAASSAIDGYALAGTALIQISSYVTTPAIRSGKLKTVLSGFQVDSPAIWVMYPQNRHLTPRVRAFVDFLVDWAK